MLSEAKTTPAKTADMCSSIKEWYGPAGSKIVGLITWSNAPPLKDKPAASAAKDEKGGGKHRPK